MIIVGASGKTGVGKSTFLNAFASILIGQILVPFIPSSGNITFTEGLWIFPRCISYQGTNFLLLDLEGLGSVKKGKEEELLKKSLEKIFIAGSLISSVI